MFLSFKKTGLKFVSGDRAGPPPTKKMNKEEKKKRKRFSAKNLLKGQKTEKKKTHLIKPVN